MTEEEALASLRGDDPAHAAQAETALWTMWCRSGIPRIDALLRQGVEAMERQDLGEAESCFARIIEQAPAFAEGWNKRATVRYLAGNYEGSIADCRETLARNAHHFGALSGQGLCHFSLGQHREAAALFRRALEVHPHLTPVRRNLALAVAETVKGNGHRP
ncbi:MAG TPA: tetratricopeptide repeat protein [Methylomirabilota bacterium]|jgi:tetratricopeptide (TPR) repeat protein|nr:tetratricopeptide repeat protein [Methylomirabilota bacterium]